MAEEILDGSGNGFRAKVDKSKRLHVDAITFKRSELEEYIRVAGGLFWASEYELLFLY